MNDIPEGKDFLKNQYYWGEMKIISLLYKNLIYLLVSPS